MEISTYGLKDRTWPPGEKLHSNACHVLMTTIQEQVYDGSQVNVSYSNSKLVMLKTPDFPAKLWFHTERCSAQPMSPVVSYRGPKANPTIKADNEGDGRQRGDTPALSDEITLCEKRTLLLTATNAPNAGRRAPRPVVLYLCGECVVHCYWW